MKRIEGYGVIDKKNKITNRKAYLEKVGAIQIREIHQQDRILMCQNSDLANSFFFDLRKINYDKALTVANIETLEAKIY